MRQKIKEALKQGHKNLGLSDEVFERVAASVETFITDESQIDGFVTSENTLNLLKSYQSVNDKLRAFEKKNDSSQTPPVSGNQTPVNEPPTPQPQPQDIAKLIAEAVTTSVASAVKPLQEKLTAFETEKAAQSAIDFAKKEFFELPIVKANQGVGNVAWKNVLAKFDTDGKQWDKDKLFDAVKNDFNDTCSMLNIDTTKVIDGDGYTGSTHDFKAMRARLQKRGKIAADQT